MQNGTFRTATSFLAGGLIGAGIALLFAPQTGKKTRRDIAYLGELGKNKCQALEIEFKHAVDNLVEGVGEKLEESLEYGKTWTGNAKDQVLHALDAGRTQIREKMGKVATG